MNRSKSPRIRGEASVWALVGLFTRLPFATRLPYHWDGVQFVMGLSHYDVRVHQPHPPGYLLYVGMGRLLLPVAGDGHRALVWVSLLFSGLGAAVLFRLVDEVLGRRPARTATTLFLTGPLFWFFGEIALTYLVDFTLVGLIALYAYRLYRSDVRWSNVVGMAASLSLAGGVRATTLLFLAPLCVLAAITATWPSPWRRAPARRSLPPLIAGAGLVALVTVAWLVPTAAASGGWSGYWAALAIQREFVNETAVWNAGWDAVVGGLATHAACLINALGAAVLPLVIILYLRLRESRETERFPPGLAAFLLTWGVPSALFYGLVHFGSPGYAMTYLGAVLLAAAWALETLWTRLGARAATAVFTVVAALDAGVFLGGAPFHQGQTGFGVVTARELRDHEECWQRIPLYLRAHYRSGEVALLVTPSFTDGLRVAQYLLPEYWPATALAVDPEMLRKMPPSLLPGYFRYRRPDQALRDARPTLCLARTESQRQYYRKLFGKAYREVSIGGGVRIGVLAGRARPRLVAGRRPARAQAMRYLQPVRLHELGVREQVARPSLRHDGTP
jgi:4-amino-4-deoxy-L-arabinose transferase-like glycosyltransferase